MISEQQRLWGRQYGWGLALAVYSGAIWYISSAPVVMPGPTFFFKDKLLHAIAFGLLAIVAWNAFRPWPGIVQSRLWAWSYAVLYGGSDEWHQYYVPGRHADPWDWLADALGATLFLVIFSLWQRYRTSRPACNAR